jgi:hypothetical protein
MDTAIISVLSGPRLAIDAFGHTLEHPETVLPVYALLNRIRFSSSDAVSRPTCQWKAGVTSRVRTARIQSGRSARPAAMN